MNSLVRIAVFSFLLVMSCAWGWSAAGPRSSAAHPSSPAPIQLHPENPHYFRWRGKPTILITAGEHYGAVLNLDFDYGRYLDELKAYQFNLTRLFSGAYREVAGSFGIKGNTLAPAPGRFTCPWARSATPGATDGGNKFDLAQWDPAYFERLKDFVAQAGRRGIVVELVLFCTMYDENLWNASPMSARNNINGVGSVGRSEVYNAKEKALLEAQLAVTRKLVTELNRFDNVYFEVCNEPYERGGLTKEWNDQIVAAIVEAEAALPRKHLIAQGFPPGRVSDLNPRVSILNFHAAKPEAVQLNYHLNKVIADDETGGSDRSDRKYRTEAWEFILAGGGVYDHLDFSFTPDHEDGKAVPLPQGTPGGGGPELRRQLRVLKEFIEGFDFIRMAPRDAIIKTHQITISPDGSRSAAKPTVRAFAEVGKAYAIHVNGGTKAELALELPAGAYLAKWVDTKTGRAAKTELFRHEGGDRTIISPIYAEDIALRVTLTTSDAGEAQPKATPAGQAIPSWLPQAPPLPPPQGEVLRVATVNELLAAVDRVGQGGTILLADGHYKLPRVIVLDQKKDITIRGAAGDPTKVTLSGKGWDSQAKGDDLIHIGRCEGVTLADLTFTDCRSYGVKVEAENAPKDIHIYNCRFRDIGVRAIKGSAGQDPNIRAVKGSVRYCSFENTKVPPADWLYGGDYIAAIDMMALEDWTFSDNFFRNIKGRNGGGRAAIFIWVRSRRVVVERNVIINCDRGVAFGNPGQSTANLSGERLVYVAQGSIRNNFIAGGPDCGIELWYADQIQVFHNTIWRPERNWSRGIRVGTGTAHTDIVNNLVHGEIQLEGGESQLRQNLAGRLEGYFVDPASGNLALTSAAVKAIDQGVALPGVTDDIRRRPRINRPDLGAWEFEGK